MNQDFPIQYERFFTQVMQQVPTPGREIQMIYCDNIQKVSIRRA